MTKMKTPNPSWWEQGPLGPWFGAVARGDEREVSRMIEQGVDVESRAAERHRPTALLLAAQLAQPESLKLLIAAGADVAALDSHGRGLAHWAVAGGGDRCLALAIDSGCDLDNRADFHGSAPTAAAMSSPGGLRQLIAAGVDIHARDGAGQTLLMLAARFGQLECCQILIEAGIDLDAASSGSTTAVVEAAAMRKPEIVALLARAGCDLDGALEAVRAYPIHTQDPPTPEQKRAILVARENLILEQIALREARDLASAAGTPCGLAKRRNL